MTHGTPENIAGSHPIVGKGLYKSSSKLRNHSYRKGEYSRIPLLYDTGIKKASNRSDYGLGYPVDMTIEEVCNLVIRSLKNAEKRIIEQSGV